MVKFGVVGCGHIGKRHAEMIVRDSNAQLVALCDIRNFEDLGIDQFQIDFFQEYKSFLNFLIANKGNDILVVSICVPNGLHASFALQALDSGCHVIVEKPLALNSLDAKSVMEKAEKENLKVFCVMQNRYSPPSQWLKKIVSGGILGNIYLVQINCFWNRDERYYQKGGWHGTSNMDGGTLFTQFSHFVDIAYWLFGDIENICAKFFDFNHQHLTEFEDSGLVNFEFRKGGVGVLNYSTSVWNTNQESSLTIIAENGSLRVGGQYMDKVEYCHVKDYQMPELSPTMPGNDYGAYKGSAQNHHFVIENVIDVLTSDAIMTTNILEGVKVVEIIEKIYSLKTESFPNLPKAVITGVSRFDDKKQ